MDQTAAAFAKEKYCSWDQRMLAPLNIVLLRVGKRFCFGARDPQKPMNAAPIIDDMTGDCNVCRLKRAAKCKKTLPLCADCYAFCLRECKIVDKQTLFL